MKSSLLFCLLMFGLLLSQYLYADAFDQQRPNHISDDKWAELRAVVQETKLLPTPEGIGGERSQFGYSVSIDGNWAMVGGPFMAGTGVVYVYKYDGTNWIEEAIITPVDGDLSDNFGYSISLAGHRALIGAYDQTSTDSGSAYIFDFNGSQWVQTQKLSASDAIWRDKFGYSVSLSGNRALIGAWGHENNNGDDSGAAYVFEFNGNAWIETQKLFANDGVENDRFGISVSLSGDRAIIGNDDGGDEAGTAYVFDYNGTSWVESQKLTANDAQAGDFFGVSVGVSGSQALVGASRDDSGSVYVFELNGTTWTQTQKLTANDGSKGDSFGFAISLSGNRVVIGAQADNDNGDESGAAYIFDFNGTSWVQSQKIISSDGDTDDFLGFSVGISGDQILVGAWGDDDDSDRSGATYTYGFNGVSWTENQKLTTGNGAARDYFGISVSLFGNRALIGAPGYDSNQTESGSAYIFDFNGSTWVLSQKLTTQDNLQGAQFGSSVSLRADRALIGAWKYDLDTGADYFFESGAAYIFDFNGTSWVQTQKLIADDAESFDNFGFAVRLYGNRALIGAPASFSINSSGAAYVFDFNGTSWVQTQKLTSDDAMQEDRFGYAVSLSDNRALVSALNDDHSNMKDSGSAYIFDYSGSTWLQSHKLIADDASTEGAFGASVSLRGDRALIGSPSRFTASTYFFEYNNNNWIQKQKLVAKDNESRNWFGSSVNLSSDDQALIGAPGDGQNGENSGAAYRFIYDGNTWIQREKITPSDAGEGNSFGYSVSLSGDQLLIGSHYDNERGTKSGSAYMMRMDDDLIYQNSFEEIK